MDSILEALFNMTLGNNSSFFKDDPDYEKSYKTLIHCQDMLEGELSREQNLLFDRFMEAEARLDSRQHYRKFICGFHVGALIMQEIMSAPAKLFGKPPQSVECAQKTIDGSSAKPKL